jgi:hypothetical protein
MKKIYISGKITDPDPQIEEENKQAFCEAEKFLKNFIPEAQIYNPVVVVNSWSSIYDIDRPSYKQALYHAMEYIWVCDTIYMLRGWKESLGAQAELALAKALKLDIIYESNEL